MTWTAELSTSDSRAIQIIDMLTREGLLEGGYPQWKAVDRYLTIWLDRKYSRDDLESATLLTLDGRTHVTSYWRNAETPSPRFSAMGLHKSTVDAVCGDRPGVVVLARVRSILVSEGLLNIGFGSVVPVNGRYSSGIQEVNSWCILCPPWWELTSTLLLPTLSALVELIGHDGAPFIS